MRILPRADIWVAVVASGILVAGSPTEAAAQRQGPSASATVRASVTILDPVQVDGPLALKVTPVPSVGPTDAGTAPPTGRVVEGAARTHSPVPVSVHTTVENASDSAAGPASGSAASSPLLPAFRGETRQDEGPGGDLRVTYTVSVIL